MIFQTTQSSSKISCRKRYCRRGTWSRPSSVLFFFAELKAEIERLKQFQGEGNQEISGKALVEVSLLREKLKETQRLLAESTRWGKPRLTNLWCCVGGKMKHESYFLSMELREVESPPEKFGKAFALTNGWHWKNSLFNFCKAFKILNAEPRSPFTWNVAKLLHLWLGLIHTKKQRLILRHVYTCY